MGNMARAISSFCTVYNRGRLMQIEAELNTGWVKILLKGIEGLH